MHLKTRAITIISYLTIFIILCLSINPIKTAATTNKTAIVNSVNLLYQNSSASNVSTKGMCGDNVYYDFDSNGTLKIYGSGEMRNYKLVPSDSSGHFHADTPWDSFKTEIKNIIIDPGVTSIGDYAFYEYSFISSVTISNTISIIGDYVFYSCSGLNQVALPNSVATIGNYAFTYCTNLNNVIIPSNVKTIKNGAFSFCKSFTDITIPNSVTSLGADVFSGCEKLKNVSFLNKIEKISSMFFCNCKSLTNIIIPDSVTEIGTRAFLWCSNLTSITIGENVSTIDGFAFDGCYALKDVYYSGSENSWKKINIKEGNSYLENATIHFNYENDNKTEFNISNLVNDVTNYEKYCAKYYSNYSSPIKDALMTYKEIETNYEPTQYVINNMLSFGWNAKFGFTDSSQIWETVLLDILMKSGAHSTTISSWEKESIKTTKSICDFLQENTLKDLDKSVDFNVEKNLQELTKKYDASKGFTESTSTKDVFKKLVNAAKTIKEFVDLYSKYISLRQMLDSDMKGFLSQLKNTENYRDIPAFSRAINQLIDKIDVEPEKLVEVIINSKTSQETINTGINVVLGLTVKALLGEKVFVLIDITKTTTIHLLDTILGVGDISNFNVCLYILDKIDDAASEAYDQITQECLISNGDKHTRAVIGGLEFFSCLYTCGIKTCRNWVEVITTDVFSRIESGPYINVKIPHYDLATDYLNLNHKSSNIEKREFLNKKCDEDEKYTDIALGNLPYFATVTWYEYSGQSQDENTCLVIYCLENPNGTHSYFAQITIKNTLFNPPNVPLKSGYNSPSNWFQDKKCTIVFEKGNRITQNIVLYSKYATTIWHEMTKDNTGIKILNIYNNSLQTGLYVETLNQDSKKSMSIDERFEIPVFIDGYEVHELGDDIFRNFKKISRIYIPSVVSKISTSAFNSLNKETIFQVELGSYAEKYLLDYGYKNVVVINNSTIYGDFDGNGTVNTKDRIQFSRYLAKWMGYKPANEKVLDLNEDGNVNTKDRIILSRHLAKWIGYESLPYKK